MRLSGVGVKKKARRGRSPDAPYKQTSRAKVLADHAANCDLQRSGDSNQSQPRCVWVAMEFAVAKPKVPLKLELDYYSREQLAAAADCCLATVTRALAREEISYDAVVIGRRCFSQDMARQFAKQVADRRAGVA